MIFYSFYSLPSPDIFLSFDTKITPIAAYKDIGVNSQILVIKTLELTFQKELKLKGEINNDDVCCLFQILSRSNDYIVHWEPYG